MQRYRNLSGNSGVASYESGASSITVRFVDGDVYVYDAARPGRDHVVAMKRLADAGRGLATYISQNVQRNYARKLT